MALKIAGQKFGRLTAIERIGSDARKKAVWSFACECGNSAVLAATLVVSGHTTSCGCLRLERLRDAKGLHLQGQKFGRLTVLQEAGRDAEGSITWECLCDCGGKTVVSGKKMKSGNTTSCGCRKKEILGISRLVDYVGMRFGRLTVIGDAGKTASGIKRLVCRCDCGGERVAPQNSLTGGKTVSCGCALVKKSDKPLMPRKALEYAATRGAIRRASMAGSGGRFTPAEIERLRESQRGKCAYCLADLRNGFHRDHIQPISLGGSSSIDNIQLLCPTCNQRKGAKDPIEFAQQMGLLL